MFSHLIGNSTAKQLLEHMAEKGSVPCSLLFYGPASACKKEFAIALARRLLATHKKEPPDLHLLLPEGEKTLHHPITAIRALIQEASLPPFEAPCKVFIIDDAEKMLPASSNALLKTLEEPPEKTYIILIAEDPKFLLPTIVSRCQKVPFFSTTVAPAPQSSLIKQLLAARSYTALQAALGAVADELDSDLVFEELLSEIRKNAPENLEKTLEGILEARLALQHHVKLKTVLEKLILRTNGE